LMRLLGSFCKVRRSRIFIPVAFHPLLAETKVINYPFLLNRPKLTVSGRRAMDKIFRKLRLSSRVIIRLGLVLLLTLAIVATGVFGIKANPGKAQTYKVGLVTDTAGIGDKSFNWMAYQGLLRAEQDLGVVGQLYQSATSDDFDVLLQQCVADGNDMCIGVGFLLGSPIENAANLNPSVKFAVIDVTYASYPPNLRGLIFASDEVGYLAGALSALMTTSDKLGVVGGMMIPPVDLFIDGYRQGALCTNLQIKTMTSYTNDFNNIPLGEQAAQAQLNWGADVIFAVAGGTGVGVVKTATQDEKWAIGVDSDFYDSVFGGGTAPGAEYLLTSAMKRVDNAVYDTIKDLVDSAFSSGEKLYDLANDGVGLAPFHEADPAVSQGVRDHLAALKAEIISGAIDPRAPCPGQAQVGLVSDIGGFNDNSFNSMAYQGLLRAQVENGVYIRTYESTSQDDYAPYLQRCVNDGNGLCISVGFLLGDATLQAANANPSKKFAIVDFSYDPPLPNVRGINFAVDQPAYLAGVLAASMPEVDMLGVIGGMQIPPVDLFIAGFQQGARCVNPDIPTLLTYAGDFNDPELGSQIAQQQIAQGADVIFPVAGPTGYGAAKTAAQAQVWTMGVDNDYYDTVFEGGSQPGAEYLLTSVMKRIDNAVYGTILDFIAGNFSAGDKFYDLASDGVGLAPFHAAEAAVSPTVKSYLDMLAQDIIAGNITSSNPCRYYNFIPIVENH
jgi:basic membrane protein A and related proteins